MPGALKLRAEDAEDLGVISAILQDALVPVADMAFLAGERRFVMVANRFRWERARRDDAGDAERTLAGLCFEGVDGVKRRGFSAAERDRILELLALRSEPGAVRVDFAGGASLLLETARLAVRLDDIGEPWPTPFRPQHNLDET
jgi:hypothetical protein